MHRVRDDLDPMSLRLSRVLDDVGVNESMMGRRRRTYLQRETVTTMRDRLCGLNISSYCFGSQSEGTTTTEMGSDLDILDCYNNFNAIQDWHEWQAGKWNLLMIKDETTPPRHRTLQAIRDDSPEPLTIHNDHSMHVYDQCGRVLMKNNWLDDVCRRLYFNDGLPFVRQGPSRSFTKEIDHIIAFRCNTLPKECEDWVNRPRPGHWPTRDMLREARECGCFLLAVGHPESEEYEPVEWRLSPSLIERILMFRMNVVQLKCYVILKLIKTSLLKPIVGDHLTSFHCKTALFYTIEKIPLTMWKEHKLLLCVQCCLRTLYVFLRRGFCPHYIISDMNLFAGKLSRHEQHKLSTVVHRMISGDLNWLFSINCDKIGPRLQKITSVQEVDYDLFPCRLRMQADLAGKLNHYIAKQMYSRVRVLLGNITGQWDSPDFVVIQITDKIRQLSILKYNGSFIEQRMARIYIPHLCSILASIQASNSTFLGLPISLETISLFQMSLNTDVASSRLKLASMLYCRGQYEGAVSVLQDVENRYGDHVQAVCGCGREYAKEERNKSFTSRCLISTDTAVNRESVAYCIRFLRQEACCVPMILLYEMFRSIGDDIGYRHCNERAWMDWAVIDALPYMYYLQYLTYGELGRRDHQLIAFQNLRECLLPERVKHIYHHETAMNLLGHCRELENQPNMAHRCYSTSLAIRHRNNAANWHIRRIQPFML